MISLNCFQQTQYFVFLSGCTYQYICAQQLCVLRVYMCVYANRLLLIFLEGLGHLRFLADLSKEHLRVLIFKSLSVLQSHVDLFDYFYSNMPLTFFLHLVTT